MTAIAYFPGIAALAVAYFYSVGAITKIAQLRGAGFSPGDALPLIPIPQLLALGVSTRSASSSWRSFCSSVWPSAGRSGWSRRLDQLGRKVAGLEQQERELREKQPSADETTNGDEAQPDADDDDRPLAPGDRLAEIGDIEADLRGVSELVNAAAARLESIASDISETEDLIQLQEELLPKAPDGPWGTMRHPVQARRRRVAERELQANRDRLAEVRQRLESQKAELPPPRRRSSPSSRAPERSGSRPVGNCEPFV